MDDFELAEALQEALDALNFAVFAASQAGLIVEHSCQEVRTPGCTPYPHINTTVSRRIEPHR